MVRGTKEESKSLWEVSIYKAKSACCGTIYINFEIKRRIQRAEYLGFSVNIFASLIINETNFGSVSFFFPKNHIIHQLFQENKNNMLLNMLQLNGSFLFPFQELFEMYYLVILLSID